MPTSQEVIQPVLELRRTEGSAKRAWNIGFLRSKRSTANDCVLQTQRLKLREKRAFPKDTEQNGMTPYPPQHTLFKAEGLKKEVPWGYSFPHGGALFLPESHLQNRGVPPPLCCGWRGLPRKKCLTASAPEKSFPFTALSDPVTPGQSQGSFCFHSLRDESGAPFWPRFN